MNLLRALFLFEEELDMSHIGNKLLAGFYATPLSQGQIVKDMLQFKESTTILDTTCGEGEILSFLQEDNPNVTTYGVEIEKGRALKAQNVLDVCIHAPIESCIITNNIFGLTWCNPPYDISLAGIGDTETERKEYTELTRATRYLKGHGIMVYLIPSYRFADQKIARLLATYFEDVQIARFDDKEYEGYKQCVFIGRKKLARSKTYNEDIFNMLLSFADEDYILEHVQSLSTLKASGASWIVPAAPQNVPTFYSRLEPKGNLVKPILENKGFHMFKERTKPRDVSLNGQPIINIAQGQLALLLAAGMVNGIIGKNETLHALQGLEIVTQTHEKEETESGIEYITRTKRSVSIKVVTPVGHIIKLT